MVTRSGRAGVQVWLLVALGFFGCARATGSDPGSGGGGAGGGSGSGGSAGSGGGNGGNGNTPDADGGAPDLGSDGDMATPPAMHQCIIPTSSEFCPAVIYVSTAGDDTQTGTTPAQAVRRISVGITKAVTCGCAVVVAGGTYSEPLQLHDGVDVYGGYTQDFTLRDPTANLVTITSTEPQTISADGLILPTVLDGVTVAGATLAGADGRSSTAVYVHASHLALTLSHVFVNAGRGADGTPGTPGTDLACGTTGASGGTAYDCGGSTGATGTAAGDPISGGGGGTGGSSNCPDACPLVKHDGISDGSPGNPGGNGSDGTGGVAATNLAGSFTMGTWSGALGGAGTRGFNGTGGGGGGSGGTKRIRVCFGCGTLIGGRGGDGAPGGCGGGPGGAGGAGGGSFGLVLDDADVNLDTVAVTGGQGGNGGVGGDGKAGQPGGTTVNNGIAGDASSECGLIYYYSGGGALGGVGGVGGNGGGGSGGVGGPSIALVRIGASTTNGTPQLNAGSAGGGGAGGLGPGPAGASGPAGMAATDGSY